MKDAWSQYSAGVCPGGKLTLPEALRCSPASERANESTFSIRLATMEQPIPAGASPCEGRSSCCLPSSRVSARRHGRRLQVAMLLAAASTALGQATPPSRSILPPSRRCWRWQRSCPRWSTSIPSASFGGRCAIRSMILPRNSSAFIATARARSARRCRASAPGFIVDPRGLHRDERARGRARRRSARSR